MTVQSLSPPLREVGVTVVLAGNVCENEAVDVGHHLAIDGFATKDVHRLGVRLLGCFDGLRDTVRGSNPVWCLQLACREDDVRRAVRLVANHLVGFPTDDDGMAVDCLPVMR